MSSNSLPLLVVLGATGNQGGSVIKHFLNQSPATYRLRGLTRNASAASAQALTAEGVEMVAADVDDLSSLQRAFEGADAIFAVTDFWGPYVSLFHLHPTFPRRLETIFHEWRDGAHSLSCALHRTRLSGSTQSGSFAEQTTQTSFFSLVENLALSEVLDL